MMAVTACTRIRRFLIEEDGATSIEYCVMLMLIILAVITAVQVLGGTVSSNLQDSSDKIKNAAGP